MGHQAGVEPNPPDVRPVRSRLTTPIQPSLPGSHPKGTASLPAPTSRLVGDSMNTTWCGDPDVVLPGCPFQLDGLGSAQPTARIPFPDAQEGPTSLASPFVLTPRPVDASVVDREQHSCAVGRHPMHMRRDGHGEVPDEFLGLEKP